MKKFILSTIIALFIFSLSQAQQKYWNASFQKTRKGLASYYSLQESTQTQEVKTFYRISDDLKVREVYTDTEHKKEAKRIDFYESGIKKQQIEFGLKTPAKRITKYYESGAPRQVIQMYEVVLHGPFELYYENGQKMVSQTYDIGTLTGPRYTWYENGQLRTIDKGGKTGSSNGSSSWTQEGQITRKTDSLLSDGTIGYFDWDAEGQLLEQATYRDGKLDGIHQYWYKTGKLAAKGESNAGKRTGNWEFYDPTGELIYTLDCQTAPDSLLEDKTGKGIFDQLLAKEQAQALYLIDPLSPPPTCDDDIEPKPLNMRKIQLSIGYPQIARDKDIQGEVVVRVLVNTEGTILRHKTIENPHFVLHNAVLIQLYDLKFSPAYKCGEKVLFWVNIPFAFKLM